MYNVFNWYFTIMDSGILYLVATPIGNLGDISLRALDVLKSVDLVLSEDTRETFKLFNHFGFKTPQISYRDQNHIRVSDSIIALLSEGKKIALVSDSGTPLISDPGFKLVQLVITKGYQVVSIPGASSVISALTVSGLPTDKFSFLGFLPRGDSAQKKVIEQYASTESTLVIFESPFRLAKTLNNICEVLGDRKMALVNDLTKLNEKIFRGVISYVTAQLKMVKLHGEFIILIAKEDF